MQKSLYEIQVDHATIVAELLDAGGEITPEMEQALAINEKELKEKAIGYALRIKEFEGLAVAIKAESKRLSDRAANYEKTAERLKKFISDAMDNFKINKIEDKLATLSFRPSQVVEFPETFADNILQYVIILASINKDKVDAAKEEAAANGVEFVGPDAEILEYFKLGATVDKAKMKTSLKEGVSIPDVSLKDKKNLQIK